MRLDTYLSQARRAAANKDLEEAREEAEEEVGQIAGQLRKGRRVGTEVVTPSILGWRVNCPHCGDSFIVKYSEDGSYELTIEA